MPEGEYPPIFASDDNGMRCGTEDDPYPEIHDLCDDPKCRDCN